MIAAGGAPAVAFRHGSARFTDVFAIQPRAILPWLELSQAPIAVRDSIGPDSDVLEVDHGVLFTKAGLNSMVLPP